MDVSIATAKLGLIFSEAGFGLKQFAEDRGLQFNVAPISDSREARLDIADDSLETGNALLRRVSEDVPELALREVICFGPFFGGWWHRGNVMHSGESGKRTR